MINASIASDFGTIWMQAETDRITFSVGVKQPLTVNGIAVYGDVTYERRAGKWTQVAKHGWLRPVESRDGTGRLQRVSTAARRKVEKFLESKLAA